MGIVVVREVAGVALGYLAALAMSQVFTRQSGVTLPVVLDRTDVAFAGLLMAVAGAMALIPAAFAYRQTPARALRA